jgi:RNA polymerase sigma-70 factor (ECF subfamily)
MGSDETAALVRLAQRGDAIACERLVRDHLRAAFAVALSIIGNPADAEDLAQEALMVAFERLDSCRDPSRFSGWLLKTVRNRTLNAREKRRVRDAYANRTRAEASPVAVSASLDQHPALKDRLLSALGRLTQTQREVVLLHDMEEYSHAEIAAAMSISEVSSRQHLFKGRRTLRKLLQNEVDHG